MAFNKKTWKDRLSEFATRRILTDQDTGTVSVVEVARSEGTIYQQGDAFSAENMNDLEDRIEDAIENVTAVDGPMTDAAYDALTEAEKMDGTIRVVGSENEDDMMAAAVVSYDNTDSGLQADDVQGAIDEINQNLTELGGIRYNKTTDMVQLQDSNGLWHDWKTGGLLFDGILYNAGAFSSLYPMSPVTSRTSSSQIASVTLNSANIEFKASTVSSPSSNNAVADIVTDAPIDITGFTTLKVQVTSLSGNNARMGISANNSSTPSYEAGITIQATGLQTVDISAYTGEHYVRVGADESTGAGTVKQTTFTVTKIWLE